MIPFQQSLGIDIQEGSLRLVLLAKTVRGYKLLHHLNHPVSPTLSPAERQNALAEGMVAFCRKYRARPNRVVLGVPLKETLLRCINIPAVKPEDIPTLLEYEIERHFPVRKEDVYFDYITLGREHENLRILLAAVGREKVIAYQTLLQQAKLKCDIIDIAPLAVFNVLLNRDRVINPAPAEAAELLISLNDHAAEMTFLQGGRPVFVHYCQTGEESLGGACNTEEGSLPPGVQEIGAEADGCDAGAAKPDPVYQGLRQQMLWLQKGFYQSGKPALSRLTLMGPPGLTRSLAAVFKEKDNLPVQVINAIGQISSYLDSLPDRHEMNVALAAAIRGFADFPDAVNLLPSIKAQTSSRSSAVWTAVLAALLLMLGAVNGAAYYFKRSRVLGDLEAQIQSLQPNLNKIGQLEQRQRVVMEQLAGLSGIQPTYAVMDILKELTVVLPDSAWLEQVSYREYEVDITGQADSAASLIPLLEESPMFENVKFTSAITNRDGERERFRISMELKGSPRLKNEKKKKAKG